MEICKGNCGQGSDTRNTNSVSAESMKACNRHKYSRRDLCKERVDLRESARDTAVMCVRLAFTSSSDTEHRGRRAVNSAHFDTAAPDCNSAKFTFDLDSNLFIFHSSITSFPFSY